MADAKISALVDGTTPDDADDFVIARAGSTLKLTWAALKAAIGGSLPAGVPILYGPVALLTDAAPQSQTLWTLNAGDIILNLWLEITSPMDAQAGYEVYTDATDFIFPATALNAVIGDPSRWTPLAHPGVVASATYNDNPSAGIVSVPSRMRTTTAVTCDKTNGAAGGAGVAYALVIPAA